MDVAVTQDTLAQAIGKSGQNVRLSSQITGWKLNVIDEDTGQNNEAEKNQNESLTLMENLDVDEGYKAAERCALSIVSQANKILKNDLNKIKSCVKLVGFVNSNENYTEQPKVINGASDTIVKIFGDKGMHTRAAVSVNSFPLGVAVEVDAIYELN